MTRSSSSAKPAVSMMPGFTVPASSASVAIASTQTVARKATTPRDLVPMWGFVALIGLLAAGLIFAHRRSRKRAMAALKRERRREMKEEKARDEAQRERAAQVEAGVILENGKPKCKIDGCDLEATECTLRTGRPWYDKIVILKTLNKLWGLPPRYSVTHAKERGLRLCVAHRDMARQKLEAFHGQLRAQHSEFNRAQQHKVHTLDQGLELLVTEELQDIAEKLTAEHHFDQIFHSRTRIDSAHGESLSLPARRTGDE